MIRSSEQVELPELQRSFTTADTVPSDTIDCSSYDRIIVYWVCSEIVDTPTGLFGIQHSHDGLTWYSNTDEPSVNGQSVSGVANGVWFVSQKPGKFARITFAKTGGTSITLSSVIAELKS